MSDTDHKPTAEEGYERTDVQVPVILKFGVVLVIMMVFSGVASWAIFRVLFAHAKRADPVFSPLAVLDNRPPPEPRLIQDEPADLASVLKEEEAVLTTYDWVDKANGVVRIPIDRAIELMAKDAPSKAEKP